MIEFYKMNKVTSLIQNAKNLKELLSSKKRIVRLENILLKCNEKINRMMLVDPLTKCYNWRYFQQRVKQELDRAQTYIYDLSFISIDIDYFRQINELYTVKAGDYMITQMVSLIKTCLRKEDIIIRWREDEFFIILPYLSRQATQKVAARIRAKVFSHKFKFRKLRLHLKVSVGFVSFPEDNVSNTRDIINALEGCLTIAKKRGGNTVVNYSQPKIVNVKPEKRVSVKELKSRIGKLNTLLTRDLLEMIYGFARAIEAKDLYTGRHVEDTALIAEKIAQELKLPKAEVENIKRAAVLHDLGKVSIDKKILSKNGSLTRKEKEVIQMHPTIAAEILREIHALHGAIPAILYHHERFDGKGYPLGVKGEEIPLGARIVAIADVYQALISTRPYRRAYTKVKALKIIKDESGKQFDPDLVKVFLSVIKRMK